MFKKTLTKLSIVLVLTVLISSFLFAGGEKITESKFKVAGICEMCKTRIEKSMKIKEVKYAKWNVDTHILKVAYNSKSITLDSLMQRVAAVGHDTEKFTAIDEAYATLHKCCLYRHQSSH